MNSGLTMKTDWICDTNIKVVGVVRGHMPFKVLALPSSSPFDQVI